MGVASALMLMSMAATAAAISRNVLRSIAGILTHPYEMRSGEISALDFAMTRASGRGICGREFPSALPGWFAARRRWPSDIRQAAFPRPGRGPRRDKPWRADNVRGILRLELHGRL